MSPLSNEYIETLAEKRLLGTLTPEEQLVLDQWLTGRLEEAASRDQHDPNRAVLKQRLFDRITQSAGIGGGHQSSKQARLIQPYRWWAAAAAVIIFIAGSYWLLQTIRMNDAGATASASPARDIPAPKGNRAMITLANGTAIYLDSAGNGTIASQDAIGISKLSDGQIVYQGPGNGAGTMINTLSNPRGSKVIAITLSDGSKVWLNAESSIRYPVSFTGKKREVEISGEAYFEVTASPEHPFIVSKGLMQVQVLGTHFNINAYENAPNIKVTLLEGSLNVLHSTDHAPKHLLPGQQAIVKEQISLVNDVDIEEAVAWKNDLLSMRSADIHQVMQELARWYDLEIHYQGDVQEKFKIKMSRNTNLSNVFKILEATGAVHFNIEGRKITVMP